MKQCTLNNAKILHQGMCPNQMMLRYLMPQFRGIMLAKGLSLACVAKAGQALGSGLRVLK